MFTVIIFQSVLNDAAAFSFIFPVLLWNYSSYLGNFGAGISTGQMVPLVA